ncbi:MAG: S8 family serine peptidase, partial [Desulfobacterales bacterium]
ITFAANTAIDSDVNDPEAPYASNDLYDDPLHPENGLDADVLVQRVSRLVTLGGYVNQPGQGSPGRSIATGDVSDFFVADLTAGQTVALNAAEAAANIDLFLYADQNFDQPVASSTSAAGGGERIPVATAGTYFIEVRSVSGASNYTLNLSDAAGEAQAAAFDGGGDFVPGEVIVKFKEAGSRAASAGMVSSGMAPAGLTAKAGEPDRAMLFGVTGASPQAQATGRSSAVRGTTPSLALDPDLRRKLETLAAVAELRERDDVAYAEPNYLRRQQRSPSDTLFNRQWHYSMINLPRAWDTTTGSANVIVAVIDTGVLFDHPDLTARLTRTGYDFVRDVDSAMDGNGIDPDPSDAGAQNPGTSIFHGSHVAGTIAAQTNNGVGVAGVGWNTRIMPVRALGKGGSGSNYDIMQAVRYAAGLPNDSRTVPAQMAAVINLSLSGNDYSGSEQDLYDEVQAEGIAVVAAAGNNASSQPVYPAAYDGVLAVSGVDINEQPARYSNFGFYVDLAAPGGDLAADLNSDGYGDGVLSTAAEVDGGGPLYSYSYLEGTSMAAAHVSGVIALMKAVNPNLTPDDLDRLLAAGSLTREKGAAGRDDRYGHGLIDAQKAVSAAPPGVLTVSPQSLAFGTELNTDSLTIGKTGAGPLTLLSVTANAAWIDIVENPAALPGEVPARYTILVDRTGLAPGTYTAVITCASDNNTVAVPVSLQVALRTAVTTLNVNPQNLDFGTTLAAADLTVSKTGSEVITVRSVTDNAAWLVVTEVVPGAGASGALPTTYRVQANRTGLAPGEYRAIITIASDSNTIQVPVIMKLADPTVLPTILTASPASIYLGSTLSNAELTIGKSGTGAMAGPYVDVSWLAIEEVAPAADGVPARYHVTADRTGLAPGEYTATISFSASNAIEVPVVMSVASVTDIADGTLYVQLRDPDTFETVYSETVFSENGVYRFNFAGVAAGRYVLSAGTDLDNDNLIGDGGEAYLSLAQPVSLQVNQNLSGLKLGAGFNIVFSAQSR